jgi:hypothetical protein
MNIPYTIELHQHRLAAWVAATGATASPLCRFKVDKAVQILETCGFNPIQLVCPNDLPIPSDIDEKHKQWREAVIQAAQQQNLKNFSHGIAAKLINCYLKVRFVCAGQHDHARVKCLHPPIDAVLLKALSERKDVDCYQKQWRQFYLQRWSKYGSDTYQDVINLIRLSLPIGEPLWKIEKFWAGHQ